MDTKILALGIVGGVVPDVLRIIALRTQGAPSYLSSWFFWVSLVALGLIGGFTCWLLAPTTLLTAFTMGYSAPSILERLAAKAPTGVRDRSANHTPSDVQTLREWWGM
jgi:hypothetical protein